MARVFALLISVATMRAAGNLPFSDLADAGLAKIERALPSDKIKDLRAVSIQRPWSSNFALYHPVIRLVKNH